MQSETKKPVKRSQPPQHGDSKRDRPLAIANRLLWLDGKISRSVSSAPLNRRASTLKVPLATHQPSSHSAERPAPPAISSSIPLAATPLCSSASGKSTPPNRTNPKAPEQLFSKRRSKPTLPTTEIGRTNLSLSHPNPKRSAFERAGGCRLSDALDNLESTVHEATQLAEISADPQQVEDICGLIEDAGYAIHEASGDASVPLMAPVEPLRVSDTSESIATSQSGSSTGATLLLPRRPVQASSRGMDFALRPVPRDPSRGRAQWRPIGDGTESSQYHRHRHNSDPSPTARVRHQRHTSTSSSSPDAHSDVGTTRIKGHGDYRLVRENTHHHTFDLHRRHRRQPIARNWSTGRKRFTATIACLNTAMLGIIVGIYVGGSDLILIHVNEFKAGEAPSIQYYLADENHRVIIGNAVLYFGLALSTFIVWPLPLLHGRKPYLLAAFALALPLQFPQAVVVGERRSPDDVRFRTGLLTAHAATGLVLGFANVNYITVLLDLFGASLQSKSPHQEFLVANDPRRHGGGMGIWLGLWSWCWIGSLALGFQIGATVIESLSPDWGFYVVIICLIVALILNILCPETRRATYRKSVTEVYDRNENFITRRVVRGECKLHISTEGPLYWFEEVWAGMKLIAMMMYQPGFCVMAFYVGWMYAQIVLVIILLGALLSKDYRWQPHHVGAGVVSIAIGAFLSIPLTKAGLFSRDRKRAFRTDSMTFQKQISWSSHLVRRVLFTLTLPLMGIAYTVSAAGKPKPPMVPIAFAGALGFLSVLGIAECHGLIMETFDTCDLQPGANTRHRLQSMAVDDRRRRTDYTSFPRVTAGIFASQCIAFILAGVATLVGGNMTRRLGAQMSTGITAAILFGLTILHIAVLWRFKQVQVIPNHTFGTRRDTATWKQFKDLEHNGKGPDWKAVVIGNPSGKMRRMSVLELGSMSRWTEIRKMNYLIKGSRLGEDTKRRRGFRGSG